MRGPSHINCTQTSEPQIFVVFIGLTKQHLIQTHFRSNYNQSNLTLGDTAIRSVACSNQPDEVHQLFRQDKKVINRQGS